MKRKRWLFGLLAINLFCFGLIIFKEPMNVLAVSLNNLAETEAGIGFSEGTPTITSDSDDLLFPTKRPSATDAGKLPQLNMLAEPFVLLILGWALVIFIFTIYYISKKRKQHEKEQ